ncbi:MAG: YkgJ family cysteine cluster protein [Halobacteriota archaeon]
MGLPALERAMSTDGDLEVALEEVRNLEVTEIAEAIEAIGFACTRCGACCRGHGEDHTATIFPEEVRRIADDGRYDWRDVARPMPYGLDEAGRGETIEWAIQTDDCGDCSFLEEGADGGTACAVYRDRPAICRTYPFSLAATPGGDPLGAAVERRGPVVAHECEGLGEPIDPGAARELARALKERAETALLEALAVREHLRDEGVHAPTVVVDGEGRKRPDGTPLDSRDPS